MKKRFITSALIVGIFFVSGQGCCPHLEKPVEAAASAAESRALSEKVKQLTRELGYSDKVGEDLFNMAYGWKDGQGEAALVVWKRMLDEAKRSSGDGVVSEKQPACASEAEERIANRLYQKIRKEVGFDEKYFDLAEVVKHRQAQCLGYSQLFYVLGNSIGLSVKGTNVIEYKTDTPPRGLVHTGNIIGLDDGGSIMADLMPRGFISEPFMLDEEFGKRSDYWELRNQETLLEVDRKFQILGGNELAAYVHNNRAGVYSKGRQYNEALAELNTAIGYYPKYAEAYYNRGIVYYFLGQYEQAVSDYGRAIELNPNFAEGYYGRGNTYVKLELFNKAIADYDRAVELNPNFAEVYYNRGNAYGKLGLYDEAVANYTEAIRLNSKLAEAYGNRGLAYVFLKKNREAEKDLLKAARLDSTLKAHAKIVSDRFNLNTGLDNISGTILK